ncbi:hypothetical protein CEXT_175451 [Caerostris extrusa]|uniref:Uncharacterized protein n=1 Tax=Caerostris extrusa TaxID=172846 RepID=A0AAV4VAG9_CAEEX|nr:hypothetical protein CEXT_175451 [Caerostris extrusa]
MGDIDAARSLVDHALFEQARQAIVPRTAVRFYFYETTHGEFILNSHFHPDFGQRIHFPPEKEKKTFRLFFSENRVG